MKCLATLATGLILLGLTATAACAVTLVVNTTADPGAGGCTAAECTLREAITQANTVNNTTVVFKIPTSDPGFAGGVFTIKPTSALPSLTGADGTTIDGTSEAVFLGSDPNPLGPDIVLNGALAGAGADGLAIQFPSDCTIKGLVINEFAGNGVRIFSEVGIHNSVLGCYIGTNPAGTAPGPGNGGDGIHILSSAASNYIGGVGPGTGNLISGNAGNGIQIVGADNNLVRGNIIGPDRTGSNILFSQVNGVVITSNASGNTIGGNTPESRNVISGNDNNGVIIRGSSDNAVRGNYIDTNATGTAQLRNGNDGVQITTDANFPTAQNNVIGGTVAGARNLIRSITGVRLDGSGTTANIVQGNYIGLDVTGTKAIDKPSPGYAGVFIEQAAHDNLIGGNSAGARNVVSGYGSFGVYMEDVGTDGNKVFGNYIGTNAAGTAAIPNGHGVAVDHGGVIVKIGAQQNHIGSTGKGTGNLISGNVGDGVQMFAGVANNFVQGNLIGLNAAGTAGLPNSDNGVRLYDSGTLNLVGGTAAAAANRIAFNKRDGVLIQQNFGTPTGDAIIGNRITKNGGLGINLQPSGEPDSTVTPNDPNDPDAGPNQTQNCPVLTSATVAAGNTVVNGTLNSLVATQFFIDFYRNTAPDPSGFGEGEVYLGRISVMTNAAGNATFTFTTVGNFAGQFITATATDPNSNTSEFSKARNVVPKLSVNDVRVLEGNSGTTNMTFTIALSAASPDTVTVDVGTVNGTATAPADYTAVPLGTRTFMPGTTSKTVTVMVKGELLNEVDETFKVLLSNPIKAVIADGTGNGYILNDDAVPALSINDVSGSEGNSGTTGFTFTVKLSVPSGQPVTVAFSSADGSAVKPADYTGVAGTLTLAPGTTSKTFIVPVKGEPLVEPDETFFVNLSSATHATIADNQGKGVILNDDASD